MDVDKIEQVFETRIETPLELMSLASHPWFSPDFSLLNVAMGSKGNSQHLPLKLVIQHLLYGHFELDIYISYQNFDMIERVVE